MVIGLYGFGTKLVENTTESRHIAQIYQMNRVERQKWVWQTVEEICQILLFYTIGGKNRVYLALGLVTVQQLVYPMVLKLYFSVGTRHLNSIKQNGTMAVFSFFSFWAYIICYIKGCVGSVVEWLSFNRKVGCILSLCPWASHFTHLLASSVCGTGEL